MDSYIPDRDDAYKLLREYVSDESLLNHSLMVEAVMAHFAKKLGEDVEKWRTIGLIHDLDFQMYPEDHCKKTKEILEKANWPKDYINSVLSHAWQTCTDVEPTLTMEKVIYTIDELTGLIYATALMRPSKSLDDLKVKSVKKKWKQKSFAQGVDREVIQRGIDMLDMDLNEVIEETIEGMKAVAEEIALETIKD